MPYNLEEEEKRKFKPNTYIDPTKGVVAFNPATQGYVASGDRKMILIPGGTITNFPTSRDYGAGGVVPQQTPQSAPLDTPIDNSGIVNKALQPQIQATIPPPQPIAVPGMSRNEQLAQSQQWQRDYTNQIKQTRMLGRDPTEWTTDEILLGGATGGIPDVRIRRKTPSEKAQDWNKMNMMAMVGADAVTSKDGRVQPVVPPATIFPETAHKHADSWFYDTAPSQTDKRDQAMRVNYRQASKLIQDQIIRAAINHPKFKSKEDIQSFIQGLGIDERFGQLAENTMTTWLEKANPDLMNSIRGDQEVQRVNDQIIINFVRQHSTVQGADQMSNEQALAAAKADPALMQQIKREGALMVQGPDHKPMAQPFTEEQKVERKATVQTKEWQLLKEAHDAFAAQHPDFASRLNPQTGKPQLMAKEELIKEQNKVALEQHREERATQTADIQALVEERMAKKAALENSPQYKQIVRENEQKAQFLETRLKMIENRYFKNLELEMEGKMEEGSADKIYNNALKRLEENPRYKPTPLPVSSITDQQGRVITPTIAKIYAALQDPTLTPAERQLLEGKLPPPPPSLWKPGPISKEPLEKAFKQIEKERAKKKVEKQ